ncbi:MAG TPA: CHAT domain-containing protein, partial [Microcoleaceae cyanobacterium]
MSHLVILNLGKGDYDLGCPAVTAQLWLQDDLAPMQVMGSLPAAPELGALYYRWQQLYGALYAHRGWRQAELTQYRPDVDLVRSTRSQSDSEFEIEQDETYITDVSEAAFKQNCQELYHHLNTWLNVDTFRSIDRHLRTRLMPSDQVRLIITAENHALLRLPWHLWHFLEDYPRAELALSLPEYTRSIKTSSTTPKPTVNILAILGNRQGINITRDQELLEQLPDTALKLLVEPNLEDLHQQLWHPGWDVLFFAGHSSSQGTGRIYVNATESLTIAQLRLALKKAIEHGLKLAIFNSCDGLELAWSLADLQIPQVIVMREPVPDRIAQEFLKHFLTAFSSGQSLYLSVREARERLQALETQFPCATWLPVICQNPAELPPRWQDWCSQIPQRPEILPPPHLPTSPSPHSPIPPSPCPSPALYRRVLLGSLLTTGLVLGIRWFGLLQPLELWAFDRLLTLRPQETPDL